MQAIEIVKLDSSKSAKKIDRDITLKTMKEKL